jgi:hypothetical protein
MTAAMAATAAGARDATRLEPLVCFYFVFYTILLIFFLGPLNALKRRWLQQEKQQQQQQRPRRDKSRATGIFIFYTANVYFTPINVASTATTTATTATQTTTTAIDGKLPRGFFSIFFFYFFFLL